MTFDDGDMFSDIATVKEETNVSENKTSGLNGGVFDLPVFGPADVFPMMPLDDLEMLAEDIKENGLKEPIVVGEVENEDGELIEVLIDGRNRREACRIAEVEPEIKKLEGGKDVATAYVLSVNVNRRHMTAGQRAAVRALLEPEGSKGGRGKKLSSYGESLSAGEQNAISKARFILRHDRELLLSVINGSPTLSEAYKTTKDIVDAKVAEEEENREEQEKHRAALDGLRRRYPDLARKVEEDGLSIKAMLVEADELDRQEEEARRTMIMSIENAVRYISDFSSDEHFAGCLDRLPIKAVRDGIYRQLRITPKEIKDKITAIKSGAERLSEILSELEKTNG